jgi:hypothetical protein
MKTKTFSPLGSMHPYLFFAVVYAVALLFSIFICSMLFYSCNTSSIKTGQEQAVPIEKLPAPGQVAVLQ